MEYYFFINPVAGRTNISGSLPPLIRSVAQHCGIAPERLHISVTQYPGHAREMAREAAASGQEAWLFAAGGDGTLNEVVSGAMGSPNAAVGCLPYGSGNDFLRNFGEQEEFCDLENQLRGGTMPIDLIQTQRGCAASICSAGLDARVAYGIPAFRRLPFCGGGMAYKLSILRELTRKCNQKLDFVIDGRRFTEDCLLVAVCNGRAYGGGFLAAPQARMDDGILDVIAVRNLPLWRIPGALACYQKGTHFLQNGAIIPELADAILYCRAQNVEIRPANAGETMIVNVDGECGPDTSLQARLLPLAGRVVLPASVMRRQCVHA